MGSPVNLFSCYINFAANVQMAFERLPAELRLQLLADCTDIDSLKSLALTSQSMYSAFKAEETQLCRQILVDGGIGNELLHDVLAVDESARHCRHTTLQWSRRERRYLMDKVSGPCFQKHISSFVTGTISI